MQAARSLGSLGPCVEAIVAGRGAAFRLYAIIDTPSAIDPLSPGGRRLHKVLPEIYFFSACLSVVLSWSVYLSILLSTYLVECVCKLCVNVCYFVYAYVCVSETSSIPAYKHTYTYLHTVCLSSTLFLRFVAN